MNELQTDFVEDKPMTAISAGATINAIVPQTLDECFRLSQAVSQSNLAPYALDTPQKIMIAMMTGLELGLPPMTAIQSVAVINNRPCLWGDALIGVVRSKTDCEYINEWIEGEGDDMVAYCETRRRGEADPVVRKFSVADAVKAGLWQTEPMVTRHKKNGGTYEKENDSPWFKYPKRMLQMRARALCLRDVYADHLKGIQIREEVEDYPHRGPDRAKDVTPTAERLRQRNQEAEGKREGFDPDYVAGEIDATMGETEIQEHTESDASATEGAADNAGEEAAASVDTPANGEGDESADAQESPSPDDDVDTEQSPAVDERFIYAVRQMLEAAELDIPVKDRAAKIQELKQFWSTNLTKDNHAYLKTLYTSALAIANGKANAVAAKEFYADMLDCTPADLEPQE